VYIPSIMHSIPPQLALVTWPSPCRQTESVSVRIESEIFLQLQPAVHVEVRNHHALLRCIIVCYVVGDVVCHGGTKYKCGD